MESKQFESIDKWKIILGSGYQGPNNNLTFYVAEIFLEYRQYRNCLGIWGDDSVAFQRTGV